MVNQPFKPRQTHKVRRKLTSGEIVYVKNERGTRIPIKLSYVKKPGPGNCLRGVIQKGKYKGKHMSFSRQNVY